MMLHRRLQALIVVMLLLVPQMSAAQSACFSRIAGEMSAVGTEYRSHLFGSRRDRDGSFTVLTGGFTDRARTGIFETKGRMTSELIDPLVESYRVYRCRTQAVCQALGESFGVDGGMVDVRQLGCEDQVLERYGECYLGGRGSESQKAESAGLQSEATAFMQSCQTLAAGTLAAERAILKLMVGYDSGYRSLLQFSGMIDWVLAGFPTQTVKAVADMVNLLGKLHEIPCFIGQCDMPDTADIDT